MSMHEHSDGHPQHDGEDAGGPTLASAPALFVCPYCGGATPDQPRCASCRGFLDPLSRQASQNAMGPWFIRNPDAAFQSGCSYETVVMLLKRGRVTIDSVLRSPTTHQFWTPAKRVPGIANLLGLCHNCGCDVDGDEAECPECHADFAHRPDRQSLGLMPVRAVPGQPVPVAAEAPSHAEPPPQPAISAPPAALLRHVTALEAQARWTWGVVVVLLAALGVTVALTAAALLSGFVRVDPAWGGSPTPATDPGVRSAPAGDPEPSAAPSPDPAPVSAPAAPAPQPAVPEVPAAPVGAAEPAVPAGAGHAEIRRLIGQDTDESLNEAVRQVEALRASGRTEAELDSLLATARTRLVQRALKGVR